MSLANFISSNDYNELIDFDNKFIIGIAGKKGTGKNTVANMIEKKAIRIGLKVAQIAFGDTLKTEVARAYGIDKQLCYTQEGKDTIVQFKMQFEDNPILPKHPECKKIVPDANDNLWECPVRVLLQWYGTEYRRKQDPDYWVKCTNKDINELCQLYDVIIVTDVRFPNEYNLINTYPVHYLCRMNPYKGYRVDVHESNHASETALDKGYEFEDEWKPQFGEFHLKMVANKIHLKQIIPFYVYLNNEHTLLKKSI